MSSNDKSTIDEIARLRDFAIDQIKCNSFNFSTGEMIKLETIDINSLWEISERAYRYSDKFYYARSDASPREPHFLDYFLKELCKIPEFSDLTYEILFSGKLFSVQEEVESSHIEQMENISARHEEEIGFIEQRHEEETELIEQKHEEEIELIEQRHEEEIELIEQRHVAEIEDFEKFKNWIEKRSYSSSQIDSLKSIFDLREKGILEVSELARIFNKILDLKFD